MRRQRHGKTASISAETVEDITEDKDDEKTVLTDDEKSFLLSLNAKDAKKQDHYRVLQIKSRFTASDEDIKKACEFLYCF